MTESAAPRLEVSVLGPIQVWRAGEGVDLGTPRQRTILAALALSSGRTVSLEQLVERVWSDSAPPTAITTLQRYVASLRQALEPERPAHERPSVLVTDGAGYALRVPDADRDTAVLEEAITSSRRLLSGVPDMLRPQVTLEGANDAARAAELLQDALALWRGQPYTELPDDPDVTAERARLDDLRVTAVELRVVALLALGRHAEVVGEVEAMTALHPLRERWWALYAIALVRSGRQGDALEALGTLRTILADQLGVDPSAPLRELQAAILHQDPSLDWAPVSSEGSTPQPTTTAPNLEAVSERSAAASGPVRWPFVGRSPELDRLRALLRHARMGRPSAAFVTGEAGVGKTRLMQELVDAAEYGGFTVLAVSCPQHPAPALWPLRAALASIGQDVPGEVGDDPAGEFALREHIIRALVDVAASTPTLLVVEDVHAGDPATLRVLEDLVGRRANAGLAVVLTRRTGAGDDAEMSRVAASVARRDGIRVDLHGLTVDEGADLVRHIVGEDTDARDLWRRSGGVPFLLAELAAAGGKLGGSLLDVVSQQLSTLPPATVTALQAACVLGHSFDVRHLALMLARDESETADLLQAAELAGLIVDQGAETSSHAFAHPVIGEVVHERQSRAALGTWHALAARALSEHDGLRSPAQRARVLDHWQAAGRSHADEAWRQVLRAAEEARAQSAYQEELAHLRRALRFLEADQDSGDHERFELLMLVADACRWGGDLRGLAEAVDEAFCIAERLEDDQLSGRAAACLADSALWQVRPFGYVHEPSTQHLERVLMRLDNRDDALRCRIQVGLAMELHFDPEQTGLIDALTDDALRTAEAIGDPQLQLSTYHGAFVALWRADTLERRSAIADRALRLARKVDDPRALVMAEVLSLLTASELGQVGRVRSGLDRLSRTCTTRRLTVPEAVLRMLALGWAALDGDAGELTSRSATLMSVLRHARIPNLQVAVGGSIVTAAALGGDTAVLRRIAGGLMTDGEVPSTLFRASMLARLGQLDAARAALTASDQELGAHTAVGPLNAALACQLGAYLEATPLTEQAYAFLTPHAGRMCSAGAAGLLGPADLYLALGAKALGHQRMAEQHLAEADRLVHARGLHGLRTELDLVRSAVLANRSLRAPSPAGDASRSDSCTFRPNPRHSNPR
jgi:DNA-binding SARP family transcriptional activator